MDSTTTTHEITTCACGAPVKGERGLKSHQRGPKATEACFGVLDSAAPEHEAVSQLDELEEGVVAEAEAITEAAAEPAAPRNIQRMTISVPVDVDMGAFEETFAVKGWSPTREALAAHILELLLEDQDLAGAVAHITTK